MPQKTLQDAFERGLTHEAGQQLTEGVHLGRSPQMMEVSTGVSCHQDGLKGAYTKLMLEISEQGPLPVGGVEDWATSKRIARLP